MAAKVRRIASVLAASWLCAHGAAAQRLLGHDALTTEKVASEPTTSGITSIDPALFSRRTELEGQVKPPPPTPESRRGLPLRSAAYYGTAPADFDGDGSADLSVKLDKGTWQIDYSRNGFGSWDVMVTGHGGVVDVVGVPIDAVPVPADYDGDGLADLAAKDANGFWHIDYAKNGFDLYKWEITISEARYAGGEYGGYGGHSWRPVPGRYYLVDRAADDHAADLAVMDEASGVWFIDFEKDGFGEFDAAYTNGAEKGSEPVPADYDGDGQLDLAVREPDGEWLIDYSRNGYGIQPDVRLRGYGDPATSDAVPSDYDGDGRADLAVKDGAGNWFVDYASDGFGVWNATVRSTGGGTARAVPADYDGDHKADLAVRVDCGGWFIDYASNGFGTFARRFDHMRATGFVSVTAAAGLAEALRSDFQGTISIPAGTPDIDLNEVGGYLPIRSCVTIKGTRNGLDRGTLLYATYKPVNDEAGYPQFIVQGHDIRVEGLRVRGPSGGDRGTAQTRVKGFSVSVDPAMGWGSNVTLDNNEMWYWSAAAVEVVGQIPLDANPDDVSISLRMSRFDVDLIRVARNNLHHNSRESLGYGVVVGNGAHATVEGNLFDHNRHAVTSDGAPYTGYVARYNYVLEGGYTYSGSWTPPFDVHGTGPDHYGDIGGEYYDIAYNTIRGEQEYDGFLGFGTETRAAFVVRGTPMEAIYFRNNIVVHDDEGEAVRRKLTKGSDGGDSVAGLHIYANSYNTDTTYNLGVGDFDRDGLDDVLLANGTAWWYSSAGQTDWRFLRASSLRIASLRFGQFDSDPATDVFWQEGGIWYFSSGGTGAPQKLLYESRPLADLVFGDFDGDRFTDVLYTDGAYWWVSWQARQPFAWRVTSGYRASSLRVGRFDLNASDDVMTVANSQWSVSYGAGTAWQRLAPKLSTSTAGLVVGDFSGDGRDDLAQRSGDGWRYWRNGTTVWSPLRGSGGQPQYADPTSALFGHFNPDGHEDAIRYEMSPAIVYSTAGSYLTYTTGTRFVGWDGNGDSFVYWTPEYVR